MKTATVSVLPGCNFCSAPAKYDALVPGVGRWAYLCKSCGKAAGIRLGLGVGQELILEGAKSA